MRCLFLWTVAVVVVLFHPGVGATCFLNNNRDVTRIVWNIFFLLDHPPLSFIALFVIQRPRSCGKNEKGWFVYSQRTLKTRENAEK